MSTEQALPRQLTDVLDLARTRRHFFRDCAVGLGSLALASLLKRDAPAAEGPRRAAGPLAPRKPHFPARAKSVIYLFMAGGPSQLELFEHKPTLNRLDGQVTPTAFTQGKRFAFLKPDAKLLGSRRKFAKYGKAGVELSELLPYHRGIVDDICLVKGMKTDVFNHG